MKKVYVYFYIAQIDFNVVVFWKEAIEWGLKATVNSGQIWGCAWLLLLANKEVGKAEGEDRREQGTPFSEEK